MILNAHGQAGGSGAGAGTYDGAAGNPFFGEEKRAATNGTASSTSVSTSTWKPGNEPLRSIDGGLNSAIERVVGNEVDNRKIHQSSEFTSTATTPFDAGSPNDSDTETLVDTGVGDRMTTNTARQPYQHGTILAMSERRGSDSRSRSQPRSADSKAGSESARTAGVSISSCGSSSSGSGSGGEDDVDVDVDDREPQASTFHPMDTRLELTPLQIKVARMMNEGLSVGLREGRVKRWLVWLPDVGNAHASIIVR